jgi:hypothetical protein
LGLSQQEATRAAFAAVEPLGYLLTVQHHFYSTFFANVAEEYAAARGPLTMRGESFRVFTFFFVASHGYHQAAFSLTTARQVSNWHW